MSLGKKILGPGSRAWIWLLALFACCFWTVPVLAAIPTVPSGAAATPGNAQVVLSWTASTGSPTQYYVLRGTTPGGAYSQIATVTAPTVTYTDSTAANNTTYFYVIEAHNGSGTSADSSEVAAVPGGVNGLLGWWKLDENMGATANDSSGFSNTGTLTSTTWAAGRSGYGGSFNGTSSVIDMGSGVIATANSFSVACWVKMNTVSGYQAFISQDGVNVSGFYLQRRGNIGKFDMILYGNDSTGASYDAVSMTTPVAGIWYHLIGVYDAGSSQLKIYVNGTLEGTQAFSSPWSATGHTVIGRALSNGSATEWTNSQIDDVRLYNRLLTAAEIATISAYPTGVTATQASATSTTISWSAFTNATSYNLYRSTTAGGEGGTAITTGLTGTSYTNTGLTSGTTYYYKLSTTTASGESAQSDEVSLAPLAAPTGVTGATSATTPVSLAWGVVSGATSYNIYRSTTSGGEGATPFASGVSGTTYNDSAATRGTTYYYTITAVGAGAESAPSSEVIVDPVNTASPYYQINANGPAVAPFAADAFFSAGSGGGTGSAVNVTAVNAAPQAVYKTERNSHPFSNISYTLPGLTANGSYVVRLHLAENYWTAAGQRKFNVSINGTAVLTEFDVFVAAGGSHKALVCNFNTTADGTGKIVVNFSNGSADQLEINGLEVLGGAVLAAPASLSAATSATTATLTWGTVSGASSYNVYRSTSAGGESSTPYQTGVASANYMDSGLTAGTTYYYKVAAVNAQGESALSNEATSIPLATPVVTGTTSAANPVTLSWGAITNAASYNIYRSTTSGGEGTTPFASGVSGTSYNDGTATRGTTYYYEVAAVAAGSLSTQSSEVIVDPVNTASPYYQINANGPPVSPFAADAYYTSSGVFSTGSTINVTAPNAAPQTVYKTERNAVGGTSPTTYTLPGLTANGTYVVRLHFSENYFSAAGWRKFNVSINGTSVLSQFDVWAAANVGNKAVVRNFNATADASGTIVIVLSNGTNDQLTICGLEIISGTVTAAPASLSAATSGTTTILTWSAVTGATSYNLYRSTSAGTEGSTPYQTGLTGTSYADTGLTANTTYYYKLVAVNAQGESALSSEVSVTPIAIPTGITVTQASATSSTLTWTAVTGATSYNLYRSTTSGGEGSTPVQTGLTGTSYTNTGLTSGTTYYYTLTAVNAAAESNQSTEVSLAPLAAPTGVTGTTSAATPAILSWSAVTGATSFTVYRGTSSGGETSLATGISGTSYNDTTATRGTTYYYTVTAVNAGAASSQSSEVIVDPVNTASPFYQINAGGPAVSPFAADAFCSNPGGSIGSYGNAITVTAVNSAPTALYQTEQDGGSGGMTYMLPGLTPGGSYVVRLHMAEKFYSSAGNRLFNVAINGTLVLTSFEIFPAAHGKNRAVVRNFNATADGSGNITVLLSNNPNSPLLDGLEVLGGSVTAAPASLSAAEASPTSASLTWGTVSGASSYNVYRSTSAGGEGSTPFVTGLTSATYVNSGLMAGTTYYYKVVAVNAQGESALSNEASVTLFAVPAAPTSLTAVPGNTSATLSWTAATGGGTITYSVLRGTVSGGPYTAVTGGTGLTTMSFADPTGGTALTNGTTYYYVVTATNSGGTSPNSNQAAVVPAVPALLLVKRITAINGTPLTGFVSDGGGPDTNAYWPVPSSTFLRGALAAVARPGDTVEYTLYFLAIGSGGVTSVVVSNILPAHVLFAPASYSGFTPTDGGSGPSGLALASSNTSSPSAPTVYLSNGADSDRGTFYAAGSAVAGVCTAAQNVNGVVVVNVVVSPTTLPAATSAAAPFNSYGFVRYQVFIR